jgi:HPt (histidine-containing phosphotransfer) domain-containing protein
MDESRLEVGGNQADAPAVVLDAAALARLRALDPTGAAGLLRRVVDAFALALESKLLPQLDGVLRGPEPDFDALRHVAHTLKSSAASVGGLQLSELCMRLEAQARQRSDQDLPNQIAQLQAEAMRVLAALKQTLASPT